MKIAFYTMPTINQMTGGLNIQIMNTYNSLVKKGVTVKLFDIWTDKINDFDIIHTFALSDISQLEFCKKAKHFGKKIVVSTIYNFDDYKFVEKIKRFICKKFPSFFYYIYIQNRIIEMADAIIALSNKEKQSIIKRWPNAANKVFVVSNGINSMFYDSNNYTEILEKNNIILKDYILHVGQICDNKNQISVIKALENTDIPLIFIGESTQKHYYLELQEIVKNRPNTYLLPPCENDDKLLLALYKNAKVVVLPSLHEVYPIVALEALATDNYLVMTDNSMIGDEMNDFPGISYISPNDIESLRNEILKYFNSKNTNIIKSEDKKKLCWDYVAENIKEIYEKIL